MNVTIRQMRLFTAAARELSFTAAAARCNITQSALTAAIRSLETALGLRLFDRTTRRVTLTNEGEAFLAVTERLLGDIDASLENVMSVVKRLRGHVSMSSANLFLGYVACPALVRLSRSHPDVTVRLAEKTVEQAIPAVLSGELDFAICGLVEPHAELASITIARDRFGVVGWPEIVPDLGREWRWEDLDPGRYVALASGLGIRQLVDRQRTLAAALARPKYEVASTQALRMLVQEGVGYGLVPAMTAKSMMAGQALAFRPLGAPEIRRELHIIKRRGRSLSPAAVALLEQFPPGVEALRSIEGVEVMLDDAGLQAFIEG